MIAPKGIRRAGAILCALLPRRARPLVRGLTEVAAEIADGLSDGVWTEADRHDLYEAVHDLVGTLPGTTDADADAIAEGVTAIVSVIAMHARRRDDAEPDGLPELARHHIASIRERRRARGVA